MASLPANDGIATDASELYGAEIVDSVLLIPTRDIELGERLRAVDPVWAAALGQLMARDGQQTPIEVCRLPGRTTWMLVAGGHRYEGARAEGIEYLRAIVVGANRDDRRLREVNENLWRKDLEPLDRAAFIAEAVAIHKRRVDPEADAARVRHLAKNLDTMSKFDIATEADGAAATISTVYGWSEEVGEQLGFTGRTIRRDLELYRRLAPSLVARLRSAQHAVARNATQLRALAKLEPKAQAEVVDALVGENGWEPCRTVAEAVKRTQPAVSTTSGNDDSKRMSAFIGAFQRMSLVEQKGALAALTPLLPVGYRLIEGPLPSTRPAFPADHEKYRDEALECIDQVREAIDGLEEDEAIPGDLGVDLYDAGRRLQLARMTIAGNGFAMSAPAGEQSVDEAVDLGQVIAGVAHLRGQSLEPDYIVGELTRRFGAKARISRNGTSELLLAGVYATSSIDAADLLRAWSNAADRRLSAGGK